MDVNRLEEEALQLFDQRICNIMNIPSALYDARGTYDELKCRCDGVDFPVFDKFIVGVADAQDPIFEEYKAPDAIGPAFRKPEEWVPGARSVVSIFFPFSDEIMATNNDDGVGSLEWQYGKFQGTKIIVDFCQLLCEKLREDGWNAVMPVASSEFGLSQCDASWGDQEDFHTQSAWSERHAAFASGLGTFGISRGLITRKGMAGRFGSIVTDAPIPVTPREYSEVYEWCSHCGACIRRCPVDAISEENGKSNLVCQKWIVSIEDGETLGDACGKCQVKVPCARKRPAIR